MVAAEPRIANELWVLAEEPGWLMSRGWLLEEPRVVTEELNDSSQN